MNLFDDSFKLALKLDALDSQPLLKDDEATRRAFAYGIQQTLSLYIIARDQGHDPEYIMHKLCRDGFESLTKPGTQPALS